MVHEYNMKIEAKTENEATEKMKAVTVLVSKLSVKELSGLAHIVKNDPVKMALAKKYMGL